MAIGRGLRGAAATVGFVGLAGAVAFGVVTGYRELGRASFMRLEAVHVTGERRAAKDELLALADVALGTSLLELDVALVEHRVAAHPWVKSARASRRLPGRLEIAIEEHEPVVLVALDALVYADAEGNLLKRFVPGADPVLPVVTGLDRELLAEAPGSISLVAGFLAALRGHEPLGIRDAEEVNLDPVRGLSFLPIGEDVRVHVGRPPWGPKLTKLAEVRRALARDGLTATELTVGGEARPERVVARLLGSTSRP